MGVQTTHDLSGDQSPAGPSTYMACWADPQTETVAGAADSYGYFRDWDDQFWEDGQHYGSYNGRTGVTLYDKRNGTAENGKPGCLMRKSRLPIDLTTIDRIEMDIQTTADEGAFGAPWYSVW